MAKAQAQITISHLIDIEEVVRYYLLQSSTANPPARPTTNPPPSSWSTTEPAYTAGSTNTLYTTEKTLFTNATFKYSAVSKSSSYEAAKQAYNKALGIESRVVECETDIVQNKEQIALKASKTEVTNIRVGGRNLAKNTNKGVAGWGWKLPDGFTTSISQVISDDIYGCEMSITSSGEPSWGYIQYTDILNSKFEPDTDYIVSFDMKTVFGAQVKVDIANRTTANIETTTSYLATVDSGAWRRVELLIHSKTTITNTNPYELRIWGMAQNNMQLYSFRNLKIERGNKATQWTPAPEDVDNKIDTTASDIRTEITEQTTQIRQDFESIILEAVKDFATTGDLDDLNTSIKAQLKLMADQMTLTFTEMTNVINTENGELNEKIESITKYFKFDINGLTIGKSDSPYKVIIDNDEFCMTENDQKVMWITDGHVYTPEISIQKRMDLFGYGFEKDASGNVNISYIGG